MAVVTRIDRIKIGGSQRISCCSLRSVARREGVGRGEERKRNWSDRSMMRISWIFRFEASSSSSNDQEVINHTTAHELVHPHNLNRPLDHTSSSIKPIHHHLNLHSYDWSIRSTPSHQATSDTSKSPIELKTSNQGLKCIYHRSSLKPLIPCSPLIIPSTSNRD